MDLERVLDSAAAAAREVGVQVVAGDTKVVPRGAADGLFIDPAGIGCLVKPEPPGPAALEIGDEISGQWSDRAARRGGVAARERWGSSLRAASDCASLLRGGAAATPRFRCAMRDATRGGVAGVLHEWSRSCGKTIALEEKQIPVTQEVRVCASFWGSILCRSLTKGPWSSPLPPEHGQRTVRPVASCHEAPSGPRGMRPPRGRGVGCRSPRVGPRGTAG